MISWITRVFGGKRKSETITQKTHADHALVFSVRDNIPFPRLRQLRFLNRVFSKSEKRFFWGAFLLFLVSLGAGVAFLTSPHIARTPTQGGTVIEGLVGTPKLINPLFAPLNDVDRDLSILIYSGLFRLNENLAPVPDIAESFRWLDDNKTLEVALRKDVRFHDGEVLNADDVMFTYQSIKDPAWHSPLLSHLRSVDVVRVDDWTIQFKLSAPNAQFLSELTIGILPSHIWMDVPGTNALLADANIHAIGSGPYKIAAFTRDTKGNLLAFRLDRFTDFYGTQPFIDEWQFRFFGDQTSAKEALKNSQIDALAFLPWSDASEAKNNLFSQVALELPQETVAFFNTKQALLKDEGLRHVLASVIDRSLLDEAVKSFATPLDSPFPFIQTRATSTIMSLENARKELNRLGWILPTPDSTIRVFVAPTTSKNKKTMAPPTNAKEFAFTITVPEQKDLLALADFLKRRWSLLGARVEVRTQAPDRLLRDALADRTSYDVLLCNMLLSADQDLSPFWASENAAQGLNFSNIADRDLDTALTAMANATSSEALVGKQENFAQVFQTLSPAVILARPRYAYLISSNIQGAKNLRLAEPSSRLLQASSWYLKTAWGWKK
jgi:peptide/nickel transport system substrate-binding protein